MNYGTKYEWLTLSQEDGKKLITTRYIYEYGLFDNSSTGSTWKSSSIRKYLNSEFLEGLPATFADRIIPTYNEDPFTRKTLSSQTHDKVFLLSLEEASMYFANDKERVACDVVTNYPESWWLRSVSRDDRYAMAVYRDGDLSDCEALCCATLYDFFGPWYFSFGSDSFKKQIGSDSYYLDRMARWPHVVPSEHRHIFAMIGREEAAGMSLIGIRPALWIEF